MKKWIFILSFFCGNAQAITISQTVTYEKGKFEGIWVIPQELKGRAPGILMIHNWMGVGPEVENQAKRFAELGYVVFAVDVYGKGVRPTSPQEAGNLAGQYKSDRKLFRERLNAGLAFLKANTSVDPKKVVAVGYCFGGTGAIELARSGAPILAAISFHGGLDSPKPKDGKNIHAKILAHHGEMDPFVKAEDVTAFEKEMKDHHIDYQLIRYPGAVHSFTDRGAGDDVKKGAAYNEDADTKSFATTRDFLKKLF